MIKAFHLVVSKATLDIRLARAVAVIVGVTIVTILIGAQVWGVIPILSASINIRVIVPTVLVVVLIRHRAGFNFEFI